MRNQAKRGGCYVFRLDEKVIVLVGGNGYLGRQFSKAILEFGGILYTLDIDITKCEEIAELKNKYPDRFHTHKINCTQKDEIAAARDIIVDKESIAYLNSQYNYSVEAVLKDSGLGPDDLKKIQSLIQK